MYIRVKNVLAITALVLAGVVFAAVAKDVPAELPDPDGKPGDSTKPIKVYILSGQSNMVGMGSPAKLEPLAKTDKKFHYLMDDDGKWTVRKDVFFVGLTNRRIARWLTVGVMGRTMGPEVGIGHVVGYYHDEVVLIIKAAQGNRSIGWDVTPPSSRVGASKEGKFYKGWQYDGFVANIHKILDNLGEYYPDYKGQGYEIAGFCWWQGHKDRGMSQRFYEKHLVNLIKDFRAEFKAPKAPFVLATVGFDGYNLGPWKGVFDAQMAISDPNRHPELAGNVASVDIRGMGGGGYHYGNNGATYAKVGDAMGRAMVKLLEDTRTKGKK